MKLYTRDELAEGKGDNGSATLVAVNGKVYDLSESKRWVDGVHMKRHKAGCDLSSDINAAPHGLDVLERFEQVGEYQQLAKQPVEGLRGSVEAWLDKHPFFRRHPHPAAVHLPIGLILGTFLFEIMAFVFGSLMTEWASVCCLIVVTLSLPAVIVTGLFTWWVNYECESGSIINWKRRLAYLSFVVALICLILRYHITDPLAMADPFVLVYVAALVVLTAIISTVGYLGGLLTFPYE